MGEGIIATDLALFFQRRKPFEALADETGNKFDVTDPHSRELILSIIMPGCDLSSATKPWKYAKHTAEVVYQEFFQQGDREAEMGIESMAIMKRENVQKLPKMQLGFIDFVVKPVYESLMRILPKVKRMYECNAENRAEWQRLQDVNEAEEAATAAAGDGS